MLSLLFAQRLRTIETIVELDIQMVDLKTQHAAQGGA
jgi:hypothetical protein